MHTYADESPTVVNEAGLITERQRRDFIAAHDISINISLIVGALAFIGLMWLNVRYMWVDSGIFGMGALALAAVIGGIFGNLTNKIWRFIAYQRTLGERPIVTREGRITFKAGQTYIARSGLRRLKPVGAVSHQRNGHYLFYCVRGTNFYVNAVLLEPNEAHLEDYTEKLIRANTLSLHSLDDNRDGLLSRSQRRRFIGQSIWSALLGVLMVGFISWLALSAETTENQLVLMMVAVLVSIGGLWWMRQALLNAWGGDVLTAEGKVYRDKIDDDGIQYFYRINNMRFTVNKRAYELLEPHRTHRLYYTRHGRQMVNIEAID